MRCRKIKKLLQKIAEWLIARDRLMYDLELFLPVHNFDPCLRNPLDDGHAVNDHTLLHDDFGSGNRHHPVLVCDLLHEHRLLHRLHLWDLLDDFNSGLIFLGLQYYAKDIYF